MSDELSLRLDLLDRQIVDADERPFGRVDDVVLGVAGSGPPRVDALLTGAQALGERLGHRLGQVMAAVAKRLRRAESKPGPTRIEIGLVETIEQQVRLRVPIGRLEDVVGLERWLARHFIERLPGSGSARE